MTSIERIDQIISELNALKEDLLKQTEQTKQSLAEELRSEPNEQKNDDTTPENNAEPTSETNSQRPERSEAQSAETNSERQIRRRTNRSFPLNKSKYLNEEQRDKVLQFANENKESIKNQPSSNRIQFLQNMVHEQLNINLSLYMTGKIISLLKI